MKNSLLVTCLLFLLLTASAHNPDEHLFFIQNQGQWKENFAYKTHIQGGTVFMHDKSWRFCFIHHEDLRKMHPNPNPDDVLLRHHAFEMTFLNAQTPQIQGREPLSHYHNYYLGNNPENWKTNVPLYEQVYYKNIYPNIDLAAYSEYAHFKHDWIIQPNGNPESIQIEYKGLDNIYLKNGNLYLITSVGELIEKRPYAYQVINGQKQEVECHFVLHKNVLSYHFPKKYLANIPLIIDPVLVFASYTGSVANNWGFTATYDNAGNAYAGGVAFEAGYPVTLGAFQSTWSGTTSGDFYDRMDIAISKFNSNGTNLLYSTYIGGTLREQPHSMIVDDNYNLYVFGTARSLDFPTTTTAFDASYNGGDRDIVVFKFNSTGTALLGSTYLGGSGPDGSISSAATPTASTLYKNYGDDVRGEIILDVFGNIYVATTTGSTDIPRVRAQFNTYNGGFRDGYVFKMSTNCQQLLWATYIGGSDNDGLYGICFGKDSVVTVCGGTRSNNLPSHTTALYSTWQGNTDGFVAQFQDTLLTKLTYIGGSNYDQAYFVQSDGAGNIYVAGQTQTATYPVVGSVYSEPGGGHFISKLDPNLSAFVYSTRFGTAGNLNISLSAFLVDKCEQLYISGWGGGANATVGNTLGMTTTSNAVQTTTDGQDFYFMVYAKDATSLLFASFYGGNNNLVTPSSGEHVDGGTSRFDKNGIIYQSVCAGCWGNSVFPATTGAWSTTNNSTNCNNAILKLDFQVSNPIIIATATASPTSGCAPLTVNFTTTTLGAVNYLWRFGDGDSSTSPNPTYTYTVPGTYMIMLIAENTAKCNLRDTAYLPITVHPMPSVPSHVVNDCDGTALLDAGNSGSTYFWTYLGNPVGNTQTITATASGIYYVTITTPFGCTRKDSITLNFHAPPTAVAPPDTSACSMQAINLVGNATGATSVQWLYGSTVVSTTNTHLANLSGMYVFQSTNSVGCVASDTVWVTYKPNPLDSLPANINVCASTPITLDAKNTGSTYLWTLGGTPVSTNQIYSPTSSGQYVVEITNSLGCKLLDTVNVNILPPPAINLPERDTLCKQGSLLLNAQGNPAYTYQWYKNGILIPHNFDTLTVKDTGWYVIEASNGTCTNKDSVQISRSTPNAYLGADTCVCAGNNLILVAKSPNMQYLWQPNGQTTSNIEVSQTGLYQLTVSSVNGTCKDKDEVFITFVDCTFAMPNVFTPNNDGKNDVFKYDVTGWTSYHIEIFNRWGNKVFETEEIGKFWNGKKYNTEEDMPEGVYYGVFEAKNCTGATIRKPFNVTLFR